MSLQARWSWELAAPAQALWRYIADTDWVNQHAGLPKIDARFEPLAGGGSRRFASFRRGPVVVEWEERPTIWRKPEFFTVERRYTRGPIRRFVNRTELHPLENHATRVDVFVELQAASPLIAPLLPLLAAGGKRGADRAFRLAERLARADVAGPVTAPPSAAKTPPPAARFAPLLDAGIDPLVVAALERFVGESEDRDLLRMRPYELADRWQLPRRETLRAFLYATRSGLFNLRWSVLCSSCRGPTPGIGSLSGIARSYHCPACNLPFDAVFDRSVEVTFDARPLGRGGEEAMFCLASPQRSAHVYAQCAPASGSVETLELALQPGTYDVNAVGFALVPFTAQAGAGAPSLEAHLDDRDRLTVPDTVAAGPLRVTIANELDRDAIVRIEDGRWPDTIVTAATVTALQEFRDLFSSEVLAPGLELGIQTIAVLFTDLVGSTAMYSRTGDAPAFRVVTDHFDILRDIVQRNEGTVVKTIGDAVMAAFVDPARCFDAAIELDRSVRQIECEGMPLQLRVGFHAGPCIAMRANDRIDYFGTTVNLAARLQALAGGGEVTMGADDAAREAIAQRLASLAADVRQEEASIKGFSAPLPIVRVSNLV